MFIPKVVWQYSAMVWEITRALILLVQPVFSSVLHDCSRTRKGVFISIPVNDLEGFAYLFMRMTRDQVFPLEDVVASFYPFFNSSANIVLLSKYQDTEVGILILWNSLSSMH